MRDITVAHTVAMSELHVIPILIDNMNYEHLDDVWAFSC